jgi:calcium permeable stress-gated cation channel
MAVEMSVQNYYFFFLFVQLFLVITISNGIFKVIGQVSADPKEIVNIFARNIPRAANYFFSYMLLQGLTTSASELLQVGTLVVWFVLRRILDNSARQKFARQVNFSEIKWGTFFPVYTNLACIGLCHPVPIF